MSRFVEESNRRMLRVRDAMDRAYAEPLDIAALGRVACLSPAHLIRTFRATFGETPHRYLQRRRVERAMYLLRATDRSVTTICLDVGFTSLGTSSRTFTRVVGRSPSEYRRGDPLPDVPTCFTIGWFGLATDDARGTYETLEANGIELTEEPTERPYGTDFGLRDPFGNAIRIVQLNG
jgi:AraC-like DNA-binding protein